MAGKTDADEMLSHMALDVWENEGGTLNHGNFPASRGKTTAMAERPSPPAGETRAAIGTPKGSVAVRTWNAVVIFQRPFILDGFGDVQPGGAYSIDTKEERLDGPGDGNIWRRTATRIRLVRRGATEYVSVDPDALVAALHRDTAQSDTSSAGNTAKGRLSTARKLNAFRG